VILWAASRPPSKLFVLNENVDDIIVSEESIDRVSTKCSAGALWIPWTEPNASFKAAAKA
jgi:hypothetical protein